VIVNKKRKMRQLMDAIASDPLPCIDLETTGLIFWKDKITGIAVEASGQSFYLPLGHTEGNIPNPWYAFVSLVLILNRKPQLYFNGSYDCKMLKRTAFRASQLFKDRSLRFLWPILCDPKISAHLLNENEMSLKLKVLSTRYIDERASLQQEKLDRLLVSKGLGKGDMYRLHPREVAPYAIQDVVLTRALHDFHRPHLERFGLDSIYVEKCAYSMMLARVEYRGVKVDIKRLDKLEARAEPHMLRTLAQCRKLTHPTFNPRSSKQKQLYVYGPKFVGLVKDGYPSTGKDLLKKIAVSPATSAEKRKLVLSILEYQGWDRVIGHYYSAYRRLRNPNTNTLHPSYNPTGTVTGRLSCTGPNLQQVAKTQDEGPFRVKEVLVPHNSGSWIAEIDYSLMELRIASHFAPESFMSELINSGVDIHTASAQVLGIGRHAAKTINFSILYGIGAQTLAINLGISVRQAASYLMLYHNRYPGIRRLYTTLQGFASRLGYIRMWSGQIRHFNDWHDPGRRSREFKYAAYHNAASSFVQGGAAEILRLALMQVERIPGVKVLGQVHDSMLVEIPKDPLLLEEIESTMLHPKGLEDAIVQYHQTNPQWEPMVNDWGRPEKLRCPLKVDTKVGKRWGQHKEGFFI